MGQRDDAALGQERRPRIARVVGDGHRPGKAIPRRTELPGTCAVHAGDVPPQSFLRCRGELAFVNPFEGEPVVTHAHDVRNADAGIGDPRECGGF